MGRRARRRRRQEIHADDARDRRVQDRNRGEQHQPFVNFGPAVLGDREGDKTCEEQHAADLHPCENAHAVARAELIEEMNPLDHRDHDGERHGGRNGDAEQAEFAMKRRAARRDQPGLDGEQQHPAEKENSVDVMQRRPLESARRQRRKIALQKSGERRRQHGDSENEIEPARLCARVFQFAHDGPVQLKRHGV